MNNLTLADKQILETYCASGGKVYEVAYDPTVIGSYTPEANAIANGLIQWYKESSPNLIEVIYTSSACPPPV
jgi:hypothetical protein